MAVITAMLLMMIILGTGLAVASTADNQTADSRVQRERESSFNLAEAAASAQVGELGRAWAGPGAPHPGTCSSSGPAQPGCPDKAGLESSFSSVDYASGASWTTSVRDNGGQAGRFYSEAVTAGQPSYDASGPEGTRDGKLWVRAQATVRGRTRVIATLVQVGEAPRPFPRQAITAGWFASGNSGNKVLVDTNGVGDEVETGPVVVRCATPPQSADCLDYDPGKGQIEPASVENVPEAEAAITPAVLEELRRRAQAEGGYVGSGCPSSLSGEIIFIESGDCAYTGNDEFNSAAAPGLVVVVNGTLTLGGTTRFTGVLYAANAQSATAGMAPVISTQGNAQIRGAVAVDGQGGVKVNASGTNLIYDPNVFRAVKGIEGANAVQGTWREIPPAAG